MGAEVPYIYLSNKTRAAVLTRTATDRALRSTGTTKNPMIACRTLVNFFILWRLNIGNYQVTIAAEPSIRFHLYEPAANPDRSFVCPNDIKEIVTHGPAGMVETE